MDVLHDNSIASMNITVSWKSDDAQHSEHYYAGNVNMWRDIFPGSIRQKLIGSGPGDTIKHSFIANEIIGRDHKSPLTLPLSRWQPPLTNKPPSHPMQGRYYPQGFLLGVASVYPQTITPMQVVEVKDGHFTVDLNHPLNGKQLDIVIELINISKNEKERGGRCSDWLQEVLDNGPGLQAGRASAPFTFDQETAYNRLDQGIDPAFYTVPRLVSHIDTRASQHLASVCKDLLQPGNRVLDLMASVDSHLPKDHGTEVTGLGMNKKEMESNKNLNDHVIHDLNENPKIPFPENSFDTVIFNLSIEYLIYPMEVIREISRVLKPSGNLLISFSNRWFPSKVTRLWTELHDFERMGYVLQLCRPYYDRLQTYSFRNWPRPSTDRHFPQLLTSDPLYVITGRVRS